MTGDAESWLKPNLNINVDDLNLNTVDVPLPRRRLSTAHPNHRGSVTNLKQKSWGIKQTLNNGLLTE